MSKIVDSIIGHAIGDAMGLPTEFCIREHLLRHPVKEMISSEKAGQPAGAWSDDTSMEICTIESFNEFHTFNYKDIMSKWVLWIEEGKYTANGSAFDVGRTCLAAIRNFVKGEEPINCGLKDEMSNGNGSLMRILPAALYSYYKNIPEEDTVNLTNELSSLTHAHEISRLGCYIYVKYIHLLLSGLDKEEAYSRLIKYDYSKYYSPESIEKYKRILDGNLKDTDVADISSKGYVVDTLECSLWIVLNAADFKETIVASTNIGNDTDTIGAITGSIAGIIYGFDKFPKNWVDKLLRKDYLTEVSENFENILTGKVNRQ